MRTHPSTAAYIKPIGGRQLTSMDESEFDIPSTNDDKDEDEGKKKKNHFREGKICKNQAE